MDKKTQSNPMPLSEEKSSELSTGLGTKISPAEKKSELVLPIGSDFSLPVGSKPGLISTTDQVSSISPDDEDLTYDTLEEMQRNEDIGENLSREDEWENHPDKSLSYKDVFEAFNKLDLTSDKEKLREYFDKHGECSRHGPRLTNDFISHSMKAHLDLLYECHYAERDSPDYSHDLLYAVKHCGTKSLIQDILNDYLYAFTHGECDVKFEDFCKNLESNEKLKDEDKTEIKKEAQKHVDKKGVIIDYDEEDDSE
jgi:hypothetical protein